ncbi:MAG: hypothetical protein AAF235_09925, partial [Planctomycetota bacterium]
RPPTTRRTSPTRRVRLVMEWRDPAAGVVTGKLASCLAAGPPVVLTGPRGYASELAEQTARGTWLGDNAHQIGQSLQRVLQEGPDDHAPTISITDLSRNHQADRMLGMIARAVEARPHG